MTSTRYLTMNPKTHALMLVIGWFCTSIQTAGADPAKIHFSKDVQPILARCVKCHRSEKQQGGLRFDVRRGAFRAGDSGSQAIVPEEAAKSELIRRIEAEDDSERMPPEGMPVSQGSGGRDHNPKGFLVWMAGGGIKGGVSFGETEEIGYRAAVDPVAVHDLHATMLHLLGLDHKRLTYLHNGRRYRLTDVAGNVLTNILT